MEPIYKIHGFERKELKKELSSIKSFLKYFWHYHNLDKDMTSFYGGCDGYPMSDEDAQKKYDEKLKQIEEIEYKLSIKLQP